MKFEKRLLLKSSLAGLLVGWVPRSYAVASEKICKTINYPVRWIWMSMRDISEIGRTDALILGREVYRAQSNFAPDEIVNLIDRLQKFSIGEGSDLKQLSLQRATEVASKARGLDQYEEWVLGAICLEMGRHYGSKNIHRLSAEIIRPYVSGNVFQVLLHFDKFASDPLSLRNRAWYSEAQRFHSWIRTAKDVGNSAQQLSTFEPIVKELVDGNSLLDRIPNDRLIPDDQESSGSRRVLESVFRSFV